jgi:hypothetical protein
MSNVDLPIVLALLGALLLVTGSILQCFNEKRLRALSKRKR